jgi:hypothetical protein
VVLVMNVVLLLLRVAAVTSNILMNRGRFLKSINNPTTMFLGIYAGDNVTGIEPDSSER